MKAFDKESIGTFLFAVIALAIFILSGLVTAREELVTIGLILPLENSKGQAALLGAEIAEADIEGEFAKPPLELVVRDSEFDQERGRAIAEELTRGGVDALFSAFTHVTQTVSPVSLETETPLFYDSCNCGFAEENPFAFQNYFDPRKECRVFAERIKNQGGEKVAHVSQDVPYASFCIDQMKEVLGEENVVVEFIPSGIVPQYQQLFARLQKEGVSAVTIIPSAPNLPELFDANNALDEPLTTFCHEGTCLDDGATRRDNLIAFNIDVRSAFEDRIREINPELSRGDVLEAAITYDAVQYGYRAARQCGVGDGACTTEKIKELRSYTPVTASSGFSEAGFLEYESRYIEIHNGQEEVIVL